MAALRRHTFYVVKYSIKLNKASPAAAAPAD
jgi:hypothetical protein